MSPKPLQILLHMLLQILLQKQSSVFKKVSKAESQDPEMPRWSKLFLQEGGEIDVDGARERWENGKMG